MIELSISASCQTGNVRPNNEDMLLVSHQCVRDNSLITKVSLGANNRYITAVADGMGGYDEGELASETALRSLSEFFDELPGGLSNEDLVDVISEWGERIHRQTNEEAAAAGLVRGTTLVSLLFYENLVFFLNCGDSRVYRFRSEVLTQLSHDHDLASLTGNEADAHVVVNCIGAGVESSFIDSVELTDRVFDGDIYLLCSDGLSDMCSDADIEKALKQGADANGLVNLALENGGVDNVSAVVVKVNIR